MTSNNGISVTAIFNFFLLQVHVDETKTSLQFASRALCITNCASVNEVSPFKFSFHSTFYFYFLHCLFSLLFCKDNTNNITCFRYMTDFNRCCIVESSKKEDRGASKKITGFTFYIFAFLQYQDSRVYTMNLHILYLYTCLHKCFRVLIRNNGKWRF